MASVEKNHDALFKPSTEMLNRDQVSTVMDAVFEQFGASKSENEKLREEFMQSQMKVQQLKLEAESLKVEKEKFKKHFREEFERAEQLKKIPKELLEEKSSEERKEIWDTCWNIENTRVKEVRWTNPL